MASRFSLSPLLPKKEIGNKEKGINRERMKVFSPVISHIIAVLALLTISTFSVVAQQIVLDGSSNPTQNLFVQQGLDYLEQGQFQQAQAIFGILRNDSRFANIHAEANYWFAQAALASGDLAAAREGFDTLIGQFSTSPNINIIEAHYHRARLNYSLGEYRQAIDTLAEFRARYPGSDFVGNSYYWSGEAHLSLGENVEAARMFRTVLEAYPFSFRVESARYKLSLIDVSQREEELLEILRWSHEEYLTLSSTTPEIPLAAPVEQDASAAENSAELLAEYRAQIDRLQGEIALLEELTSSVRAEGDMPADPNMRELLLSLRGQLLDLKEQIVTEASVRSTDQ